MYTDNNINEYNHDYAVLSISRCLVGGYKYRQVYSKPISLNKATNIINSLCDKGLYVKSDMSIDDCIIQYNYKSSTHKNHITISYRSFQDSMIDFAINTYTK